MPSTESAGSPPTSGAVNSGYLAAISPTVHRLALEMSDRQANTIANAISDTTSVTPEIARVQGTPRPGSERAKAKSRPSSRAAVTCSEGPRRRWRRRELGALRHARRSH